MTIPPFIHKCFQILNDLLLYSAMNGACKSNLFFLEERSSRRTYRFMKTRFQKLLPNPFHHSWKSQDSSSTLDIISLLVFFMTSLMWWTRRVWSIASDISWLHLEVKARPLQCPLATFPHPIWNRSKLQKISIAGNYLKTAGGPRPKQTVCMGIHPTGDVNSVGAVWKHSQWVSFTSRANLSSCVYKYVTAVHGSVVHDNVVDLSKRGLLVYLIEFKGCQGRPYMDMGWECVMITNNGMHSLI